MTAQLARLQSGSLSCRRQQEVRVSVKTRTDERLEELSDRIDQLEAKAQASGAEGQESMSARPEGGRSA
jgi:hypothetical protein